MATYKQMNNQLVGFLAGADLSSAQYKPVKFASTAGEVIAATAQVSTAGGGNPVSVVQNDPADGEPALLPGVGDICKAVAGANDITVGQYLTANSSGVLDTSAGIVFARALEASAAVGDYIQVQIIAAKL
jgi:hypothetical protein